MIVLRWRHRRTKGECMCILLGAADLYDVPRFSRRLAGGNGLITLGPSCVATVDVACIEPIRYLGQASLWDSSQPFLDAIGDRDRSTCFWSVPSPGTLAVICEDRHYHIGAPAPTSVVYPEPSFGSRLERRGVRELLH